MDTIFALASAPGKAGVSVIRISGNLAHNALQKLTGSLPDTRQAKLATLRDHSGEVLDHALVLRFDGPSSFTGEDVVELHCHGSRSVVASVLSELGRHEGFRLADPGEFTRRALENGRLDLTQVEGLADLIDAETDAQRKQAQRVFSGVLGGAVEGWRKALIRAAALIEATIDFADEDVPTDVTPEVNALLASVLSDLTREVAGVVVAERIRDGFEVAIVGPPNAGKSTLLNYLAGREAAITSEQAGTTRDIIEVRMDLAGLPVTFLDTAGLRETDDVLEQAGISRALSRAKAADLRVFLSDGDQLPLDVEQGDLVLRPKADLRADPGEGVSGATGDGVAKMLAQISEELTNRAQSVGIATRLRHKSGMQSAMRHLTEAQAVLVSGPEHYDIAAEELRCAIRALEALTGRIDVENLLDEIFASFCLGK